MMRSNHWKQWGLPVVLLVSHTLLLEVVSTIELNNAWSDQNATMLVLMIVTVLDAPVRMLIDLAVSLQTEPGTYLLGLKVLGGVFWFGVGWVIVKLVGFSSEIRTARKAASE